jgi:hypothetical protein
MTGTGFMDMKARRMRLDYNLPQGQGTMNMVMVDRVMYFHFPAALTKQLPGGRSWFKLDLKRELRKKGIDANALQSAASNGDPSQTLDQLRGAGDVKRIGDDTVRGTKTTHYKATVDLHKAAEKAPPAQREIARRSADRLEQLAGTAKFPFDVWIDGQGRARRVTLSQTFKGQSVVVKMDYFDFGTREAVKAPPASETTDFSRLLGKQPSLG